MSSGKTDFNYPMEMVEKPVTYDAPRESIFEELDIHIFNNINLDCKLTKFYGKIVNIHFFLSKNKELSNSQKLDYCSIERYFMKLYLREMMKKM
ncbi:MAG: hypothetical protein ACFE96_13705 [Candidatus Hermodarchaeota archaeon]